MLDAKAKEALAHVAKLWDTVEGRIKTVERLQLTVVFASINELRYAGRRLVDLMNIICSDDRQDRDKQDQISGIVYEIEQNIIRANNDAADAAVVFLHERLHQLVSEFGVSVTFMYFPAYSEMLSKIRQINEFMSLSREERHKRNEIYNDIFENHLKQLIQLYDRMLVAEESIKTEVEEAKKIQQQRDQWTKKGYIAGIIGAIIGLGGIIIAIISLLLEHT
jgi:hypothetical protein